jgi:glutamyl-tRNA reductase
MSLLVVGMSHKSAPVGTLERAALSGDALSQLLGDVFQARDVSGAFVVSSCNRVEVYAEVAIFHRSVSAIGELLAQHSGVPLLELTRHLYVHYEDRAIEHLLSVTCGLDSMVIGESQVLGQVRQALRLAANQGTLSRALSDLGSVALRAGKRAHAETGIDRAGASLVSVGLAAGARRLGRAERRDSAALSGLSVLVVGAGSMSSLAVATAARMGAGRIVVANRSSSRAQRLVARVAGNVPAAAAELSRLPEEIAAADLVVSCTGASGHVIGADVVAAAISSRPGARVVIDLALPRDIDPAAGRLPGVSLIDLEGIGRTLGGGPHEEDVAAVRRIVAEELAALASAKRAAEVVPTVVALRAKAAEVMDAELARLTGRLGDLDARAHQEIAHSMRRIVEKLLHAPTVRIKELAGAPGDSYESVLRVLFDLDPDAVQTATRAGVIAQHLPEQ